MKREIVIETYNYLNNELGPKIKHLEEKVAPELQEWANEDGLNGFGDWYVEDLSDEMLHLCECFSNLLEHVEVAVSCVEG